MPDSLLVDPLGRPITLHDRTWFGHILKPTLRLRWNARMSKTLFEHPGKSVSADLGGIPDFISVPALQNRI